MTSLLSTLTVLAAEAAPAGGAAGQAGGQGGQTAPNITDLLFHGPLIPIILIFIGFWWVTTRAQRRRERARQDMLGALKPKDDVVTIGGIHGRVVKVDPEIVVLRVDDDKDVKITMARSGISRVLGEEEEK